MELLKKLRLSKNLYQKDVAEALGVDRTTYVKWENGKNQPDNLALIKLANYFEVSTDYLLGHGERIPANFDYNDEDMAIYNEAFSNFEGTIRLLRDCNNFEKIEFFKLMGEINIALKGNDAPFDWQNTSVKTANICLLKKIVFSTNDYVLSLKRLDINTFAKNAQNIVENTINSYRLILKDLISTKSCASFENLDIYAYSDLNKLTEFYINSNENQRKKLMDILPSLKEDK